jgi:hypothetical protein
MNKKDKLQLQTVDFPVGRILFLNYINTNGHGTKFYNVPPFVPITDCTEVIVEQNNLIIRNRSIGKAVLSVFCYNHSECRCVIIDSCSKYRINDLVEYCVENDISCMRLTTLADTFGKRTGEGGKGEGLDEIAISNKLYIKPDGNSIGIHGKIRIKTEKDTAILFTEDGSPLSLNILWLTANTEGGFGKAGIYNTQIPEGNTWTWKLNLVTDPEENICVDFGLELRTGDSLL